MVTSSVMHMHLISVENKIWFDYEAMKNSIRLEYDSPDDNVPIVVELTIHVYK